MGVGSVSVSVDVDEVDEGSAHSKLVYVLKVILVETGLGDRQHSCSHSWCQTCSFLIRNCALYCINLHEELMRLFVRRLISRVASSF